MIKQSQGFVALTSVLILSAIFLSLAISTTISVITTTGTNTAFRERNVAHYTARGCMEYALMQLERNLNYQGNEVILIGDEECEILPITGAGNINRVLEVKSIIGAHVYHIVSEIEAISPIMVVKTSERLE